jgi:uncharacterized protein YndB with AHSA1/START domain
MLRHWVIVDAPVAEVWKAFTTKEGLESWMVAQADIELRVGGKMRTRYAAGGTLGDAETIENTILSFDPEKMISIRSTKPPESFPYKTAIARMWSVIYFEEVAAHRTRVTVTSMGFDDDEESRKTREHFDKGNAWTVDKLRAKFAPADAESQTEALKRVLKSLVGGEWTLDQTLPNGKILSGRMVAEVLEGDFMLADSWRSSSDGPARRSHTVFAPDPWGVGMHVWDFNHSADVTAGEVRLLGDNRMAYDWNVHLPDGKNKRWYVEEVLEDSDSLRFMLFDLKPGDRAGERPANREPLVNALWKRSSAPAATVDSAQSVKRIEAEVIVPTSVKNVWEAWTTSAGIATFFAQASKVELRPGGAFEMYFNADAPTGAQGSEGCTVLAYRPMEMLSFTWNAPPKFLDIRKQHTVVVVQFQDLGADGVRVALTHTGFGPGKDWEEVHQYFSKAWPTVLGRLKERFGESASNQ